jgi:hypothetical protein
VAGVDEADCKESDEVMQIQINIHDADNVDPDFWLPRMKSWIASYLSNRFCVANLIYNPEQEPTLTVEIKRMDNNAG